MSRCIPIPVPIPDQYHNAAYDNQVPGSSDTAHVDGLRCVCEEFEQKIRLPKPEEREILKQLVEEYGDGLVRSAIVEAEGKGHSANYVASILERWRKQGQPVSGKDNPSQGASYDLKEYEKATMEAPPFVGQEADG